MDEDGNLRPRNESGPPTSPSPLMPAARHSWTPEEEGPAEHEPDEDADDGHGSASSTAMHAPEDASPWYMPRITLKDLHRQWKVARHSVTSRRPNDSFSTP